MYFFPLDSDLIITIQNNIIITSGIISGIIIAYLSAKLFNIKQEKQLRLIELNKLSKKLISFKRVIFYVLTSYTFWKDKSDIRTFKKEYPKLTYDRVTNIWFNDEQRDKFYKDDRFPQSKIHLFLAMEAIVGDTNDDVELYKILDPMYKENYTVDSLESLRQPMNEIWYCLDGRYQKHMKGLVHDTILVDTYSINQLEKHLINLDKKYSNAKFDRVLFASIATEFYEGVIPMMQEIVYQNNSPNFSFNKSFKNLIFIFFVGVIFPILIQSIKIAEQANTILTQFLVTAIILLFVNFFIDFYFILKEEITY
jgi:hypothetical protein